MSIIGLGIDIIQIIRIKKIFHKFGKKFTKKILSISEYIEFKKKKNKINFLAKIFSVKEATLKSLGTGWNKKINFKNIILRHNIQGKPEIQFINLTQNIALISNIKSKHISITDDKKYVIAIVIFENK